MEQLVFMHGLQVRITYEFTPILKPTTSLGIFSPPTILCRFFKFNLKLQLHVGLPLGNIRPSGLDSLIFMNNVLSTCIGQICLWCDI